MSEFLDNDKRVFCASCGADNNAANTFCLSCGERLEKAAPQAEAATPPANEIPRVEAEVVKERKIENDTSWYAEGGGQNPYQNVQGAPTPSVAAAHAQTVTVEKADAGPKGLAIASLICGVAALFCCYGGFLVGLAGLITGMMSLSKKQDGRGFAIAGAIMSAIAIVLWGISIIWAIITAVTGGVWFYNELLNEFL